MYKWRTVNKEYTNFVIENILNTLQFDDSKNMFVIVTWLRFFTLKKILAYISIYSLAMRQLTQIMLLAWVHYPIHPWSNESQTQISSTHLHSCIIYLSHPQAKCTQSKIMNFFIKRNLKIYIFWKLVY